MGHQRAKSVRARPGSCSRCLRGAARSRSRERRDEKTPRLCRCRSDVISSSPAGAEGRRPSWPVWPRAADGRKDLTRWAPATEGRPGDHNWPRIARTAC